MKYKSLGRSGLKVSQLCLGTNNFGAQINELTANEIVSKAIDCGINIVDTANMYTRGKSEEVLGKVLKGRRDDLILATKVGMNVGQAPNQGGLSSKHILNQIEHSLKSLDTSYIDIYYLHRFDMETPLEETLKTLNNLVHIGKVRYIACSNFTAWQIAKAHEICSTLNLEKFIAVQPPYNLLQREVERELLPYAQYEGLGVLTYTPLMGGFLTGKYSKDTPPPTGTRYNYNPRMWERLNKESNFTILEELEGISKKADIPMSKLALAWILKNPVITAPIVGASTSKQVEENCQITEINLNDKIYEELNELTKSYSCGSLYG